MTEKENFAKTANWAQALSKIIPERRLQECYLRAVADHETEFPISAMNLKAAWKKICEEDRRRREANRLNEDKSLFRGHSIACRRCDDTDMEAVYEPNGKFLGRKRTGSCDHRPLEEGEWLWKREREIEANAEKLIKQTKSGEGRIIDMPQQVAKAAGAEESK